MNFILNLTWQIQPLELGKTLPKMTNLLQTTETYCSSSASKYLTCFNEYIKKKYI